MLRYAMSAALLAAAALPLPAMAQAGPTELVIAIVPSENASGTVDRYSPLAEHLGRKTGLKTTLRVANDYAAVIEGQKAGTIHIGYYGPGSYVRAHQVSGGNVVAFATTESTMGAVGYYSVAYVKADSPYRSLKDLQGKKLGLVDPNSTSGNFAPRYFMSKEGVDPEKYFSVVAFTGSHENAVIAVSNGTVDAGMNWWNSEDDSNLSRMAVKGMAKKEDFRIVWKSDLLPGSPYAYLSNMPADLKAKIERAFLEMHAEAKPLLDKMEDGKTRRFVAVSHKDYVDTEAMLKFIDELRRKRT
ncbi:MAG: phosphonate ABC transporter substrate-binding protein [Alphaproteobacteria bacterium]|nr:phosphonate ABC transporter substrate-binding protein [Alphaproteobacteria bacterium]